MTMRASDYLALAEFERVAPDLVRRAAQHQAAVVGDVAGRRGMLNGRVQAIGPGMRIAGPALTVEVRPGDNLMIHAALAVARPGDVIVVDAKGDLSCAVAGELMATQALKAGLGGFVIDGAVRDTGDLASGAFPIFAAGRNPGGPTKGVPGRISIPISVAGAPVSPGDLVLGDSDGVVVVPRAEVPDVLARLDAKLSDEAQRLKEIADGRLISPWLDAALRSAGLLAADDSLIAACERA
jgi:4-hydroxy-4-methyl-2-oxoglutarate aldolase